MAGTAAAVPAVRTIQQKIELAWDAITFILKSSMSLDEFMNGYHTFKMTPTVSVLTSRIDDLFEKIATSPRAITASKVRQELMNGLLDIANQKREAVAKYVLHTDGQMDFTPKRLMCMFVCGLVVFRDVTPFENLMNLTKDNEIEYVRDFLLAIAEPRNIVVYSTTVNGVLTIDGEPNRTIPDTLFLTSSIPDKARDVVIMDSFPDHDPWRTLSQSIDNGDIITSDPVLWYAYILQNVRPALAFADPTQAVVQCIGIEDQEKDRKYIFAYQFPTYDRENSPTDPGSLWTPYIDKPCQAYSNVLESFKPRLTADTAFISKYTYTNPMIIYIHVLVMALYGQNRNFYACTDTADSVEGALVAGKTCEAYRNLLEHASGSATALTIKENAMDENVMERLANAHLALMRKKPEFTFNGGIIDMNYDDTLNSTCPVKYEWVFHDVKLSKCASWISNITQEVATMETRRTDTLDPDLGVFRRILYWMDKNLGQQDALKAVARKFERNVSIGAEVDDDPMKHIAVELYKYGSDKGIFTATSRMADFLSTDPEYRKAMEKYFVGEWHPDNVFGKYLVLNETDKTYEVRDCVQMKINNEKVSNLSEAITERAPSSGSSEISSGDASGGYSSDSSTASTGSLPGIRGAIGGKSTGQKKGTKTENVKLPPISSRMQTLEEVVETWVDTDERVEGGLEQIFTDLDSLVTVDGVNSKDQQEKMTQLKADIKKLNDDCITEKGILQTVIDGLKEEVKQGSAKAKKDKDALEAQMQTVRDEKAQVDQDLAAALLRETAFQQEKSDMDANMQKLTREKDDLAAQVAKLTQERQESQKKAAEDAESIRKLTEKVGELEKQIVALKQEIEDMKTEKKKLLASDASNQVSLLTLTAKEKELTEALEREKQLQLEKAKLEAEKKDLEKALQNDKGLISNENIEKLKLMEDVRNLRNKVDQYELQLQGIIDKIKKGILEHDKQMTTRIWKIHGKVDTSIKKELAESELLGLLKKGEYTEFRDAVKKSPSEIAMKDHNLPALFLIYESIGGTWREFDKLSDKTQTSEFMAQKLMHVLRLFQTIEKHNEHILDTYTNKYFRKFLETFGCLASDPDKGEVIEGF